MQVQRSNIITDYFTTRLTSFMCCASGLIFVTSIPFGTSSFGKAAKVGLISATVFQGLSIFYLKRTDRKHFIDSSCATLLAAAAPFTVVGIKGLSEMTVPQNLYTELMSNTLAWGTGLSMYCSGLYTLLEGGRCVTTCFSNDRAHP